jgi:hypothetical protein
MFVLHIHTKQGVGSVAYEMLRTRSSVQLRHRGTGEIDRVSRRKIEQWIQSGVASLEMVGRVRERATRRRKVASVES